MLQNYTGTDGAQGMLVEFLRVRRAKSVAPPRVDNDTLIGCPFALDSTVSNKNKSRESIPFGSFLLLARGDLREINRSFEAGGSSEISSSSPFCLISAKWSKYMTEWTRRFIAAKLVSPFPSPPRQLDPLGSHTYLLFYFPSSLKFRQ